MSAASALPSRKLRYIDPAEFTPHFAWRLAAGSTDMEHVFCEDPDLPHAAQEFGTPTYVYSGTAIDEAYAQLDRGLGKLPHTICFAAKANGNLSILSRLAKLGSGFDIVSGGELAHLALVGAPGNRIVFSGVGKTRHEIREALGYAPGSGRDANAASGRGILLFNVESEEELALLQDEAEKHVATGGTPPGVAIRVNPDVQAGGHPKIATGRYHHKFGLNWASAKRLYLAHKNSRAFRWDGISAHIGSQIVSLKPFQQAFGRIAAYVRELRAEGIALKYLDLGGGLGVRYTDEKVPAREDYARMVARVAQSLGVHLLLEPGRSIIAPAGVLLSRVLYTKQNGGKTFVIVDAAMNDLMRPSLYGAVHPITPVVRKPSGKQSRRRVDVVGPVCETGDCILPDWPLGEVTSGDIVAIWAAGAYGMSLASNYNARCRGAEVLIEGGNATLIRRRETQDDLLRTDLFGTRLQPSSSGA